MTVFTPRSQQSKEKTAKICDYFPFLTMRLDRVAQVLSLCDLALPCEKSWTLASSLFRRSAPYTQTKWTFFGVSIFSLCIKAFWAFLNYTDYTE